MLVTQHKQLYTCALSVRGVDVNLCCRAVDKYVPFCRDGRALLQSLRPKEWKPEPWCAALVDGVQQRWCQVKQWAYRGHAPWGAIPVCLTTTGHIYHSVGLCMLRNLIRHSSGMSLKSHIHKGYIYKFFKSVLKQYCHGHFDFKHVLLDEVLVFKLRYVVYTTLVKFRQQTARGQVLGKLFRPSLHVKCPDISFVKI